MNDSASVTWKEGRGGAGGGLPSNHLQTTHLWCTTLMRLLPLIIQYLARTSLSGSLTPLCCTLWWALHTISVVRACCLSRSIGCLEMLAFCNHPPHCHTWLSFLKRPHASSTYKISDPPLGWTESLLSTFFLLQKEHLQWAWGFQISPSKCWQTWGCRNSHGAGWWIVWDQ